MPTLPFSVFLPFRGQKAKHFQHGFCVSPKFHHANVPYKAWEQVVGNGWDRAHTWRLTLLRQLGDVSVLIEQRLLDIVLLKASPALLCHLASELLEIM